MPYNYDEISHSEAKDLLRQWREGNERRSEEVMELWAAVLCEDIDKLGNEKHLVLEQVIYAALDCHTYKVAYACMDILAQEFPSSLRVMRLKAALLEAEENYTEALEVLNNIIAADKTNAAARKRRVAVLKAQGKLTDAISGLVQYLNTNQLEDRYSVRGSYEDLLLGGSQRHVQTYVRHMPTVARFMSDVEAWQELCGLYLRVGEYAKAAFCGEELLLHQPHNHLHMQRLADIRYTMGGVENLELAKTYYCQALKLNPDNLRALLGLFLTTNNLLNQYKSGTTKRAEVWKLCQWSQSRASKRSGNDSDVPLTQMMLSLSIAE